MAVASAPTTIDVRASDAVKLRAASSPGAPKQLPDEAAQRPYDAEHDQRREETRDADRQQRRDIAPNRFPVDRLTLRRQHRQYREAGRDHGIAPDMLVSFASRDPRLIASAGVTLHRVACRRGGGEDRHAASPRRWPPGPHIQVSRSRPDGCWYRAPTPSAKSSRPSLAPSRGPRTSPSTDPDSPSRIASVRKRQENSAARRPDRPQHPDLVAPPDHADRDGVVDQETRQPPARYS